MTLMSLRFAILGFLELEPSTGYILGQRFSGSVGSFWTATLSQIYRELHALEAEGLVRVDVVPQDGKPAKKVYFVNPSGQQAMRAWLSEPAELPTLRDPLLVRFVFADTAPPEVLDAQLRHARAELEARRDDYRARLGRPEIFDLARTPREALLWRLSIEQGLAWCETQLTWLARVGLALAELEASAPTQQEVHHESS